MITIKSNKKHRIAEFGKSSSSSYGLECKDALIYLSMPGILVVDWNVDHEYSFRVQTEFFSNVDEELKVLDNTEKVLKSFDKTKNTLPLTLVDDEYEQFNSEREYTGQYTNDACPVPKYEYSYATFNVDTIPNVKLRLYFQNNSEPWFAGDGYDMSDEAWMEYEHSTSEFARQFKPLKDGSKDLKEFFAFFVDDMLLKIAKRRKAILAQKQKEQKEHEKIETALNLLDNKDDAVKQLVKKFISKLKVNAKCVVDFANALLSYATTNA